MKSHRMLLFASLLLTSLMECHATSNIVPMDSSIAEKKWRLGWRLIISSWDKNYTLGEKQLDSLLTMPGPLETRFVISGLHILAELEKKEKIINILTTLDGHTLEEVCAKDLFRRRLRDIQICQLHTDPEVVKNRTLQMELIRMFLDDQAVRGNIKHDLISKFKLEPYEPPAGNMRTIDEVNRVRLKAIIDEFGFPSRDLVGTDAMQGVFMIIQHADNNREWQKAQLPHVELAVRRGDLEGQSYAYLYDRIKVNSGEKQRFGTQLRNVDPVNKIVELAETEDLANLDTRRREVGIMPIETYKQFILRPAKK